MLNEEYFEHIGVNNQGVMLILWGAIDFRQVFSPI